MIALRKSAIFSFLLFLTTSIYGQLEDSVLANGNWFKFSVDTTGVFRIDRTLLQQIGIQPDNVDPRKIQIYGNGGQMLPEANSGFRYEDLAENAIYIEGESDGSFDSSDFILFYGKGPHDWNLIPSSGTARHRQNIYSDKAYYFITVGAENGKRIQNSPEITDASTIQITTFDDFIFYEQETLNLFAAGRRWLGEEFSVENQRTFDIPFPNVTNGTDITVTVRAVAVSALNSGMSVSANGQDLFNLTFTGNNPGSLILASDRVLSGSLNSLSDNVSITLDYSNQGNPSAKAYLDYIELSGTKDLIASDFQFGFRSFEAANASGIVEYEIQNASSIAQVWDVTDITDVTSITNQSSTNFSFKANGGSLREYIVLHNNDYYTPEALTNNRVENQNLHALQDINYLLITREELVPQAQRLTNYHEENTGISTQIVVLEDIYNEFSSGSPDLTGIRDFIKYLYDNNSTPEGQLKYVCLFGDGSYDYKDRIRDNNNIVPVYESEQSYSLAFSYVTDDFYAMMENNEGTMSPSHSLDLATGRIPVSTPSEAQIVVDKILNDYSLQSLGDWRNTVTLVTDDIDATSDISIQSGVEQIADNIKATKPIFNVNKICFRSAEFCWRRTLS